MNWKVELYCKLLLLIVKEFLSHHRLYYSMTFFVLLLLLWLCFKALQLRLYCMTYSKFCIVLYHCILKALQPRLHCITSDKDLRKSLIHEISLCDNRLPHIFKSLRERETFRSKFCGTVLWILTSWLKWWLPVLCCWRRWCWCWWTWCWTWSSCRPQPRSPGQRTVHGGHWCSFVFAYVFILVPLCLCRVLCLCLWFRYFSILVSSGMSLSEKTWAAKVT